MSGYIGQQPVPQSTQTRESFTATASQTTFNTAGYTPNFLDVFLNGVHLLNGTDYTATNGSDVVLTTGAAASDIVEVISYSTYEVNAQTYTGGLTVNNDGATVLTVGRATSDGSIVDFKKSGTTVGSIGSVSSKLTVGTGIGALQFDGPNQTIRPFRVDTNVTTDAALQLGSSTNRFTNLYLSGGVYLGGTGAANKLDDYEEGTWTPTVSSGTITVNAGAYYTKVGRLVTLMINSASLSDATTTGTLEIGGLPFAPSGSSAVGSFMAQYRDDTTAVMPFVPASVTGIRFYANSRTANYVALGNAMFNSAASNNFYVTVTYQTA